MSKFTIGSKKWNQFVIHGAKAMGIQIDPEKADQLAVHCNELTQWNQKFNLTKITEPIEVAVKHVLDSIAPAPFIPAGASVLDIGSGGGFPGIPLKIIMPSISVTLIDASRKKVSFLKHVIRSLELKKIEARHTRTEDLIAHQKYANAFQVVICRSFSPLDVFVLNAIPFISEKGVMIALKGKNVTEELALLHSISRKAKGKNDFNLDNYSLNIQSYALPHSEIQRSMVILKQNSGISS